MSNLLWKYYLEDNVDKFENLLATGGYTAQHASKGHGGGTSYIGSMGAIIGSPGAGTSPRTTTKMRKSSGHLASSGGMKGQVISLTRSDLNNRDRMGLTILHRAVSSRGENAERFAAALISHPGVDLYIQDSENGWTALHRSLYFGNVATARQLMERDLKDCMGHGNVGGLLRANTLIKIKDHEGNSAFDVYNSTIARRTLHHRIHLGSEDESDGDDEDSVEAEGDETVVSSSQNGIEGDELFAFGSNKNFNLGFGDEDDRQYPTPVLLKRPDHLLHRFHQEHVQAKLIDGVPLSLEPQGINLNVEDLPALIRNRPIVIQDVALSKLHSAVLTTDPESNLYICGFGPGGRLGTGDETTKFNYVCIEGGALAGKKITAIALGQNHSIAISREGEVFTWGTNTWGQLGYNLPRPAIQDEEPINSTPRQIFGPLKRENILGVAASAIHSVAFTSSSLYTWGKNEGQLCLMDSDSRSLEAQTVPRKVAASLFTSPIVMVSAINKATVCLLSNHSVYVFTNYGYNIVKFPMHDGFANYHLHSTALTTRYEEPSHISQITSGGDTIAAVCTRGDLFTVQVSQKVDPGPTAASTTNPAKIRNALSQPQRIWSLRKGNWDGIQSVSVGENGSVIICTRAGAVWRRIQRATIKDLSSVPGKRKDFKFQRVPGLTNVAAVRSNTFGAYAAIRKDCDVTKSQVLVDDQGLWKDLAPLLNIRGLTPTEPSGIHDGSHSRFWSPAVPKEHFDGLKRAVLISLDLEADVATYIRNSAVSNRNDGHNIEISSTLSETSIPIHSFMFAARSPVMRDAMAEYRLRGEYSIPDIMTIVPGTKYLKIEFHGLDFITILNLALYIYEDTVIDVWHFTRHVPNSAYRYRQVRTELMKVAAKLQMTKLEAAVRLMVEPERRLNIDLAQAFQDPRFFEDGDAVIDLDGGEMPVHSSLLCRRCPFFEGLFNGRAAGQWLAGRRQEDSDVIRVDMKHVEPSIFDLVLRYLYADIGPELFDDIVSTDIDEFCDIVMDVMAVANELMLDRLSQICQQIIGRFANTRNICHIINAIAPCSVTEFKDAGLEYLCLQLESMLENHLLDDLDEDLLAELDEVVRENQLACLPFAKSGRAELLLHERHPSLAGDIDEERQRKLRDMAFRSILRDDEHRFSSSYRTRVGSLDDVMSSSPSQDKSRRRSKGHANTPFSPAIRPKDSVVDLMFDMDDDESGLVLSSTSPKQGYLTSTPKAREMPTISPNNISNVKGKAVMPSERSPILKSHLSPRTPVPATALESSPTNGAMPWSSTALPSSKLDMREIMAQTSSTRTSTLSMSLSAQKAKDDAAVKAGSPKMSQKERKKQQQQALQQAISSPQFILDKAFLGDKPSSPWQVTNKGPITSLKDVLDSNTKKSPIAQPLSVSNSPISALNLGRRRTASPDTRFAGQQRTPSNASSKAVNRQPSGTNTPRTHGPAQSSMSTPPIPHSRSYTAPASKAEPSLLLSMADIIGQQKREQDLIKEAVAKRSLQEIQEEQAFQEWWEQESKRAQEEEAQRTKPNARSSIENGTNRGKGPKKSRGVGQRGRGDLAQNHTRGRGRGRGRGQSSEANDSATVS